MIRPPRISPLFPYPPLSRSAAAADAAPAADRVDVDAQCPGGVEDRRLRRDGAADSRQRRSEEHTSELQSPDHLVCRLLLEKKNRTAHVVASYLHADYA